MKKTKYSVYVPTSEEQDKFFNKRISHEQLPEDWRTSDRFRRDFPLKDYIFDLEERRFTHPFWYMMGMSTWRPEEDIDNVYAAQDAVKILNEYPTDLLENLRSWLDGEIKERGVSTKDTKGKQT